MGGQAWKERGLKGPTALPIEVPAHRSPSPSPVVKKAEDVNGDGGRPRMACCHVIEVCIVVRVYQASDR